MPFTLKSAVYNLTSSFRAGGAAPPYYAGRSFGSSSETGFRYVGSGSLNAWWRLNEDVSAAGDVTDRSGNSRAGTFDAVSDRPDYSIFGPSEYVQNLSAGSLKLSGSNDFDASIPNSVNIGTAATWDALIGASASGGSEKMTFCAWVRKHGDTGAGNRILDFGNADISFYSNDDEAVGFTAIWGSNPGLWITSIDAIALLAWHHVAVTYDATSTDNSPIIYIDGVVQSLFPISTPAGAFSGIAGAACYIGNTSVGTTGWDGDLADVVVWNDTLSAAEIRSIYEVSKTGAWTVARNFEEKGTNANPSFSGSVSRFLQGVNVSTYDRFASAIAPLIGRASENKIFMSSSAGMQQLSASETFFDDSRKVPNDKVPWPTLSASIDSAGNTVYTRLPPEPKIIEITDDEYRLIAAPSYIVEQRSFGYEKLWNDDGAPFAEMDKWDSVRYLEAPNDVQYPVVLENPSAIDPYNFDGVLEPFTIRKRITGRSTFIGSLEDPEPYGVKGAASAGGLLEQARGRNFIASNFYDLTEDNSYEPWGAESDPYMDSLLIFGTSSYQGPDGTRVSGFPSILRFISSSNPDLYLLLISRSGGVPAALKLHYSRSLSSFRGPLIPIISDATSSIEPFKDNWIYERFIDTVEDDSIFNWKTYYGIRADYTLINKSNRILSHSWNAGSPVHKNAFNDIFITASMIYDDGPFTWGTRPMGQITGSSLTPTPGVNTSLTFKDGADNTYAATIGPDITYANSTATKIGTDAVVDVATLLVAIHNSLNQARNYGVTSTTLNTPGGALLRIEPPNSTASDIELRLLDDVADSSTIAITGSLVSKGNVEVFGFASGSAGLDGGLYGWWRYTNDWTSTATVPDASGNGFDGTFGGLVPIFSSSNSESGLSSSGSAYPYAGYVSTGSVYTQYNNQALTCSIDTTRNWPGGGTFSFGDGAKDYPFSVSTWYRSDDATNTRGWIACKGNWPSRYASTPIETVFDSEWVVFMQSTKASIWLFGEPGTGTGGYDAPIAVCQTHLYALGDTTKTENIPWYHVVWTYDGANAEDGLKVYVNGSDVTDPASQEVLGGTYTYMSGTTAPLLQNFWRITTSDGTNVENEDNWSICDFAVWNKELTELEVKTLYHAGLSGSYNLDPAVGDNHTKYCPMGRPSFTARSAGVGFTYDNSDIGIDSLAFGGLKK